MILTPILIVPVVAGLACLPARSRRLMSALRVFGFATALASVLLVALYNRRTSLEAAWKYVMLGSLGLALALLGTVFVYAAACKNNPQPIPSFNWSHLMTVAGQLNHGLVRLAFVLVLL